MHASGTVFSLHRWPVKSLAGEDVARLDLDGRGVAGDRTHALFDTFKDASRRLTARQVPRMLAWSAAYGADTHVAPDDPPPPTVTAPDGRSFPWGGATLPAALEADLGRPVVLRRDPAGQQDLPRSVLLTTRASLDALAAELGRDALELRRFRSNVHVDFGDGTPAFAEEHWEGARLTIGTVELQLLHPCVRCVIPTRDPNTAVKDPRILRHLTREHGGLFGINARVLTAGTIAVGDPVTVT